MTYIFLVRHAQSVGNIEKRLTGREEYELTEEGKIQVSKLTKRLENISIDAIYSSPSIRTIDTVKDLAEINKLKVEVLPELSEMYFGIFDGYKWEEVNKINPSISLLHEKTNEIMQIPEQETSEQVANRMYEAIRKIAIQNEEKNKDVKILIGSHGVAIEAFLRKITKIPFTEQREEYSQKNTSLNILEYTKDTNNFNLKVLNSITHIQEREKR